VTSRAKGNPMKDNARHVPGSTRSCRTPLSRSATPARRFQPVAAKCDHYATIMRPNFKTQILNIYASVTYNFDPQKRSHFPARRAVGTSLRRRPPFGRGCHRPCNRIGHPFSLGEKVRMRDKPVHPVRQPIALATCFTITVQIDAFMTHFERKKGWGVRHF
jgi:hypothetical protein